MKGAGFQKTTIQLVGARQSVNSARTTIDDAQDVKADVNKSQKLSRHMNTVHRPRENRRLSDLLASATDLQRLQSMRETVLR